MIYLDVKKRPGAGGHRPWNLGKLYEITQSRAMGSLLRPLHFVAFAGMDFVSTKNILAAQRVGFEYQIMRTELVTTLKRKATEVISRLSCDQEPVLITQHGLPAAYLVDVRIYEQDDHY